MILDTTVFVDVLRGNDDVSDVMDHLDGASIAQVSSVTVMELVEGAEYGDKTQAERQAIRSIVGTVEEVPFDGECATVAGEVSARLLEAGDRIEAADVMIGATARVHDVPVLTGNVEHYRRIDDLEVVGY